MTSAHAIGGRMLARAAGYGSALIVVGMLTATPAAAQAVMRTAPTASAAPTPLIPPTATTTPPTAAPPPAVTAPAITAPQAMAPAAVSGRSTLPWPDKPYPYVILDQDIRDVLAAFGSNLDIPVKVSDKVAGRVRGRLPELTPQQLLDHLAASYGLQWYYDGQVLYVTTVDEAASEMLPLGPIRFEELQASLASLRLDDPRFPLRPLASANVALINGPPRYVALVKETMQALQQAYQFQTTIVRGRTGKTGS
jgi:type III secretion protein C